MIEGSWSGMKKYLEQDMLCPALRGRITWNLTHFRPAGDEGAVFTVCLDGQPVKRFGFQHAMKALRDQDLGTLYPWDIPLNQRDEFTDDEFAEALEFYRHQPISASLESDNPIVLMFAVVDRRVGARTLAKLRETMSGQPEWLRKLYEATVTSRKAMRERGVQD
ncbi:MAG: hypothetical protein IKP40_08570 [Clostridia bacterium]|nr:hypothetical protein [Clostridia bacterium]